MQSGSSIHGGSYIGRYHDSRRHHNSCRCQDGSSTSPQQVDLGGGMTECHEYIEVASLPAIHIRGGNIVIRKIVLDLIYKLFLNIAIIFVYCKIKLSNILFNCKTFI